MESLIEALDLSPRLAFEAIILIVAVWITSKINRIAFQIKDLDSKFDKDFAEMKADIMAFKTTNSAEHGRLHEKVETVARRVSRIEGKIDIGGSPDD